MAVGTIAGAVLICYTPPYLYGAAPVDWSEKLGWALRRERDSKRLLSVFVPQENLRGVDLTPEAKKRLQRYIDTETRERLYRPANKAWSGVFTTLADMRHGRPVPPEWEARRGREWSNEFYFSDADAPFNELRTVLTGDKRFLYVLVADGAAEQHLAVTKRLRRDSMRYAPGPMAYPYRRLGFLCLLGAALAYWLLPWPKVRRESLRYSRVRSAVGPDAAAAFMVGFFVALPILIVSSNTDDATVFSPGWNLLAGTMGLFALLFALVWVFSTGYTTFSLEFLEGRLRLNSWRGSEEFDSADIREATVGRVDPQKLNRALLWLSALAGRSSSGAALANLGPELGLFLVRRDGRVHRFPLKGLIGAPQAVGRLARSGVPIDENVYLALNLQSNSDQLDAPFPPLGSGRGAFVAAALFCLLFGWGAYAAKTVGPLAANAAPLPEKPYTEPKSKDWAPTPEVLKAEEQALAEIAELQARMKELEKVIKTGSPEQRRAAAAESSRLLEETMAIHAKIERMRRSAGASE